MFCITAFAAYPGDPDPRLIRVESSPSLPEAIEVANSVMDDLMEEIGVDDDYWVGRVSAGRHVGVISNDDVTWRVYVGEVGERLPA